MQCLGAVRLGVSGLLVKPQVGGGEYGRDSECGVEKTARLG